jgi:hypothetical protein
MAQRRTEVTPVIQKVDGTGKLVPASGASVQINKWVLGTPATLYSGDYPAGTRSNPVTTDSSGRISRDGAEVWVDEGDYALVVSGTGFTTYTQEFPATSRSPEFKFTPVYEVTSLGTITGTGPFVLRPGAAPLAPATNDAVTGMFSISPSALRYRDSSAPMTSTSGYGNVKVTVSGIAYAYSDTPTTVTLSIRPVTFVTGSGQLTLGAAIVSSPGTVNDGTQAGWPQNLSTTITTPGLYVVACTSGSALANTYFLQASVYAQVENTY